MAKADKATGKAKAAGSKPGKMDKAANKATGLALSVPTHTAASAPAVRAPTTAGAQAKAAPKSRTTTRQAVVVLAMHRTGSSALSRILNLLGCDLPRTLMGGDASNETGHWESPEVRALNDDLLTSGGSVWQDWHAFNPHWYETARPAEFLPRARQVLEDEYGKTALMVFKDPRICRIFPFWRGVFAAAGILQHVLIPLRHPAEVAASLNRRNAIPEMQGLLLWLRHVLEAEFASRGMSRAVVSYDRLLSQPVETMRALQEPLGLIWPRLSEPVSAEIDSFVSPELRHHKADRNMASSVLFRDWLAQVYDILLRWSELGEDSTDHAALDGLRATLDSLARPLREVIATVSQQATDMAALDKDVRYLRGEAGKRADNIAALTAEKKALTEARDQERAALSAELETSRKTAAEAVATLTRELEATHQARTEAETAQARAEEAARDEAASLRAEVEALTEALATAKAEMADAARQNQTLREAEAAKAAALADALRADIAALNDARAASEAAQQQEAAHIAEELADLIRQNTAQAEQLAEVAALQAEIETRDSALAEAQTARQSLQDSLSETQSALRQRQHEAEETAAALRVTRQELKDAQTGLDQLRKAQAEDSATLTAARRSAEAAETARYDEIAELTQTLIKRETAITAQATRIHAVNAAYADLNSTAEKLKQQLDQSSSTHARLTQDLAAREVAVTSLMAEIGQRGAAIGHLMHLTEQGRLIAERIGTAIDAILVQAERPWLRGRRQMARKIALLEASGLFDAEWYSQAHPDVEHSELAPATHFILFGRAEGRHPLPDLARFLAGLPKAETSEN